jgi:Mg2+ and Co2+ transporter CorA
VELTGDIAKQLGDKRLLWIDIDRHEPDADEWIARVVDVLKIPLAELRQAEEGQVGQVRLMRNARRLQLTVKSLEPVHPEEVRHSAAAESKNAAEERRLDEPAELLSRDIDLVAGENVVITIHDGPSLTLDRFREELDDETRLGLLTAGDLLSTLIDEVLDGYFLVVELIEREIDDLDQAALHGRSIDDVLARIVALRARIGLVRRSLAPHRHSISTLALPEMQAAETIGRPWPGLIDRLEAAMGAVDGLRASLLGTFDIQASREAQRANDVMRTLTLLSAVLLPAVVLAAIMGMNFKLEFFDTTGNFWVVIAGMAGLALGILAIARWRRWL